MSQRMSALLSRQAHQAFVGREVELEALDALLGDEGPRVVHVHGIAGIGKTTLLERFAIDARAAGASVIRLDCRSIEPTSSGFLQALGDAIGGAGDDIEFLTGRPGNLAPRVILALDTFEVFRLLDTWLRQAFVPTLPDNVCLLLLGRERPACAWEAMPGWGHLMRSIAMTPLSEAEANLLLDRLGVDASVTKQIVRVIHGHPLALKLAAAALREHPRGDWLEEAPLQHALDELTRLFLADVGDEVTRRVLEGTSVTRRVTVSVLRALFPELAAQDAFERLRDLPFVDVVSDGLLIHDAVRDAISRSLHTSDPSRHPAYRRAAWRQRGHRVADSSPRR